MKSESPSLALKRAITHLQKRQTEEGKLVKEQFLITYESLKPVNVVRRMFSDLIDQSDMRSSLLQSVSGMVSGYLTNLLVARFSPNRFVRFLGTVVQMMVSNFFVQHGDTLRAKVGGWIEKLLVRFHSGDDNVEDKLSPES